MTIEEAIEQLKLTRAANKCNYADKYILDAFDMAIRSLEAWEKIRAEIGKESEVKTLQLRWGEAMGLNKAIEIIDNHLEELRGRQIESTDISI